jgi:3-deoxy-D-manno-octulosonic-acid transferase
MFPNFYDVAYALGLGAAAPVWLVKPSARRKVLTALRQRSGRELPAVHPSQTGTILIHAVSLGEMNATRALVAKLREMRPGVQFVISSTTETGFTRGTELYGPAKDVELIRYPLDFSGAVTRVLDHVKPDVVVLMELEVWPNFVKRCRQREIPVVLANARLTPSSFRNYRMAGPLLRATFDRLTLVCAQELAYAERFLKLGVPPHRVVITGTMKFDNASLAPPTPAAGKRAMSAGLRVNVDPIWVCGSTGPGEEEIVLRTYRRLLARFARLRLVIVPRHPQRFDEVAMLIDDARLPLVRMSRVETEPLPTNTPLPPVVLVDAMGVLRDFYAVADVVFVGRSLVDLGPRQHGSDMIEPAALGKPVIVGPFTGNFSEAMNRFRAAQAMLEAGDEESLEQAVVVLLSTPVEAHAMGNRAAAVVKQEQGATARHARVIVQILATKRDEAPAATNEPATTGATTTSTPPLPKSDGRVVIFDSNPNG